MIVSDAIGQTQWNSSKIENSSRIGAVVEIMVVDFVIVLIDQPSEIVVKIGNSSRIGNSGRNFGTNFCKRCYKAAN